MKLSGQGNKAQSSRVTERRDEEITTTRIKQQHVFPLFPALF